jgi:hypothetical protein
VEMLLEQKLLTSHKLPPQYLQSISVKITAVRRRHLCHLIFMSLDLLTSEPHMSLSLNTGNVVTFDTADFSLPTNLVVWWSINFG